MKKLICLALIVAMIASFSACKKDGASQGSEIVSSATTENE